MYGVGSDAGDLNAYADTHLTGRCFGRRTREMDRNRGQAASRRFKIPMWVHSDRILRVPRGGAGLELAGCTADLVCGCREPSLGCGRTDWVRLGNTRLGRNFDQRHAEGRLVDATPNLALSRIRLEFWHRKSADLARIGTSSMPTSRFRISGGSPSGLSQCSRTRGY